MLIQADARSLPLRDGCVDAVVTSPPYFGLRDYGMRTQIGLGDTLAAYIASICSVFRDVRRVLKPHATSATAAGRRSIVMPAPPFCPHCGTRLVESDAPCAPEEFEAQERARVRDGGLYDAGYEAGRQSRLVAPAAPGWQPSELEHAAQLLAKSLPDEMLQAVRMCIMTRLDDVPVTDDSHTCAVRVDIVPLWMVPPDRPAQHMRRHQVAMRWAVLARAIEQRLRSELERLATEAQERSDG